MAWLVLGVALWAAAHYFKRLAPGLREPLGDAGKGLVAVLLVLAIWLMVIGYRGADVVVLWDFGAGARGINNLLMLAAVMFVGVGNSKSRLREKMRHPMLIGALVWGAAHLLVKGDLASVVLFGGLGLWAIGEIVLINRAEPDYVPFKGGTKQGDIRLAVITLVVYAAIAGIHIWIGPSPFAGA